jgi:hypothetical protein
MKLRYAILGVVLAINLAPFGYDEVWGAEWMFVNTTKDGGQIYLDIENINKPSTNIIRYWLKWIKKEGDYSVFLSEMDCVEEEYRMLQRTDYSKEGKVVSKDTEPSEWVSVNSHSIINVFRKILCK